MLRLTTSTLIALLLTTACTQQAAQIDARGQNNYSRSASGSGYVSTARTYSSPSNSSYSPRPFISQETNNSVGVSAISSNDLPPPSAPKPASHPPISQELAAAPKKAWSSAPDDSERVNQWTKNVREDEIAQVVELDTDKATELEPAAGKSSFMWPVGAKKIISAFGPKGGGKANDGINIAAPEGEPVWASADGEVAYVGNELKGYGNMVIIKHSGGKSTTYAHLSRYTVDKYDRIKQGDIIGYVGATGSVKDPQLHFAIRSGKEAVDPQKYL